MRTSTDAILTTHVGSLPYPGSTPPRGIEIREAVAAVVDRQRAIGIDVVNEGEYAKRGDWLSYLDERFEGFDAEPAKPGETPLIARGKDREVFSDFYRHAAEKGTLFYEPGGQIRTTRPRFVCTSPIRYAGQAATAEEIACLRAAVGDGEAFLTSTAPASIEVYRANAFYTSEEEFLFAIADALREEYELIASAGLLVQIDDAWLPALWDRIGIEMGLEAFRKRCMVRVEALNHALARIPVEQIRYHLCWGSWHGPHAFDLEMVHLVDIMLQVKAGAYLFEAGNARHEHEFAIWDDVTLPDGKVIIPGVVSHSTDVVEHPELVSQRIQRFAERVGKERVIAGTDCGFGGRSHPDIAWAKLASLVEGARLASAALAFS